MGLYYRRSWGGISMNRTLYRLFYLFVIILGTINLTKVYYDLFNPEGVFEFISLFVGLLLFAILMSNEPDSSQDGGRE